MIANGRIGLDAQLGEYTYIGENGRSVVDYLLLSRAQFDQIVNFSVCDPTEFSDHCALLFIIDCHNLSGDACENETETPINKLIWQDDKIEDFRQTLISNIDLYADTLSVFDTTNPIDSLDTAVDVKFVI